MNIVELMMVEHASLRVYLRLVREKSADSIYELEDFVRNCHARIEDEVVFPRLKGIFETSKDENLVKVLSRLEADHKLIEMIGEQIKVRTAEGDLDTTRKRTMLYADTLESHNASEENLVFQFWPSDSESESMGKAKKIIEEYGRDRYFRITGISEKLFDLAN
ncbi:MAG TPA: hemerythrin domain-containing protein [Nitrososphaerales archaeon]|nr:hemerythrin domain-containing protein [Nitrososphaerales archaeon]